MIAARAARLLPPATLLSRRSAIRLTLAAALVLHLLAGTALLTARPHPLAPPPPPPHAATIELIQNSLARSGDGPVGAAGTDKVNAAALDHPAPPAAAPAVLPDPRRPPDGGTLPAGAAARPPVPAAFPPASPPPASPLPASPPAPAIRLSGGDDSEGSSGGTAEVPAAADPHAHNRLPAYPTAAAMLGQEGEVGAVVQIRPDGTPAAVLVMHSSGYPALDTAAVKAWQSWRFTPARDHGTAIGSEMPVTLRFVLKR